MVASIKTSMLEGFGSQIIDVESDMSNSLPAVVIVGLGAKSVDEAKERIRSALKNSQLTNPKKRVTINLSPADIPKNGTHFDLAITLSVLTLSEQITEDCLHDTLVIGEVGLDGTIKPVHGIIGHVIGARKAGFTKIIVPDFNLAEAQLVSNIEIIPAKNLRQLYEHLTNTNIIKPPGRTTRTQNNITSLPDLSEVAGNEFAKQALKIAAAGQHNLLMSGPPGGGKTLLASCIPGILPPLSEQQIIETTHLHSLKTGSRRKVIATAPFRAPHHTSSTISLIGGGQNPKPGEISLAHNGILLLDEIPEFSRMSLEALRQPLESDSVEISRAASTVTYPARFMLVATRNPCPCGNYTDQTNTCTCVQQQIDKYQQKLSGPLLDRIDLQINVSRVKHELIMSSKTTDIESSSSVRETVISVQNLQHKRQGKLNSRLTKDELKRSASIHADAIEYLNDVAEKLDISSRSYIKILRVARTIADIAECQEVTINHVASALQFRV